MKRRVVVGRNDGIGRRKYFRMLRSAELYIANVVAKRDPAGVARGNYYIDCPESILNKRKVSQV